MSKSSSSSGDLSAEEIELASLITTTLAIQQKANTNSGGNHSDGNNNNNNNNAHHNKSVITDNVISSTMTPDHWKIVEERASYELRGLFAKQKGQKSFKRNPLSALVARHRVGVFRSHLDELKQQQQQELKQKQKQQKEQNRQQKQDTAGSASAPAAQKKTSNLNENWDQRDDKAVHISKSRNGNLTPPPSSSSSTAVTLSSSSLSSSSSSSLSSSSSQKSDSKPTVTATTTVVGSRSSSRLSSMSQQSSNNNNKLSINSHANNLMSSRPDLDESNNSLLRRMERIRNRLTPEIQELAELTVHHRKGRWIDWDKVRSSSSESLQKYINIQKASTPSFEKRKLSVLLGDNRHEFDTLCSYLEDLMTKKDEDKESNSEGDADDELMRNQGGGGEEEDNRKNLTRNKMEQEKHVDDASHSVLARDRGDSNDDDDDDNCDADDDEIPNFFQAPNGVDRKSNDPSLPKELRELVNLVCRFSSSSLTTAADSSSGSAVHDDIRWDEIEQAASPELAIHIQQQRRNKPKRFQKDPIMTTVGKTYLSAFHHLRTIVEECVTKVPPTKTTTTKNSNNNKTHNKSKTSGKKNGESSFDQHTLTPELEELARIVGPPGTLLPSWSEIKAKASEHLLRVIETKEDSTRIDSINGTATKIGFFVSGRNRILFNKMRSRLAGISVSDDDDDGKTSGKRKKKVKKKHWKTIAASKTTKSTDVPTATHTGTTSKTAAKATMAKVIPTTTTKPTVTGTTNTKRTSGKSTTQGPLISLDLTNDPDMNEGNKTVTLHHNLFLKRNCVDRKDNDNHTTENRNKRIKIGANKSGKIDSETTTVLTKNGFKPGDLDGVQKKNGEKKHEKSALGKTKLSDLEQSFSPEIIELARLLEEVKVFRISKKQFDLPYILKNASPELLALIDEKRNKLESFDKNALRSLVGEKNEKRRRFDKMRLEIRPAVEAKKEVESLFQQNKSNGSITTAATKETSKVAMESVRTFPPGMVPLPAAPILNPLTASTLFDGNKHHSGKGLSLLAAALHLHSPHENIPYEHQQQELPHHLTQLAVLWEFSSPDLTHGPNWKFIEERAGPKLFNLIQEKRKRKHSFREDPVLLLIDVKYRFEFLCFRRRIQSNPDLFRNLLPRRIRNVNQRTQNEGLLVNSTKPKNISGDDADLQKERLKHGSLVASNSTWSPANSSSTSSQPPALTHYLSNEESELARLIARARKSQESWSYVESHASEALSSLIREKSSMPAYFGAPTNCLVKPSRFHDFNAYVSQLMMESIAGSNIGVGNKSNSSSLCISCIGSTEDETPPAANTELALNEGGKGVNENCDTTKPQDWQQLILKQNEKIKDFSTRLRNEISDFESSMIEQLRNCVK